MVPSTVRNEEAVDGRPLRVLILTQHFWPEQFRINSVVEDLRETGAEVAVLTGQPNYPAGRIFDGYRSIGLGMERHPTGYEIFRVPLVPRGNGGAGRLVLNYLSFLATASSVGPFLTRGRDFDVVFVYATSPVLQAFAAFPLRWLKRAPVVLWVQDLWPHVLASTGFIRSPRALSLVERVVAALYRRVDLILAQSEAFVEAIRPLAGEVPVMYFPNPGDRTCILDIEGPIRLPPGFNVVFAGNLGRAQALETVLDAASLLREERDIRITLFGSGARERWIRGEIARRGLSNVALGGRVAPVVMREIYRRASAALLTLADDAMLAKTIPSKLQSYLGAGVPVIAAATGESARVVRDSGGGIVCAPENPAALASAILKLRDCRPEEIEAMRRNAQAYYDANFEPRLLSERLMSQLRALVDERQGR